MELEGLSTAITGGASGLGLATARRIAITGGQVTLIDLPSFHPRCRDVAKCRADGRTRRDRR